MEDNEVSKTLKEIPIGVSKDAKTGHCLLNYKDAYSVLDKNKPADNRIATYIKQHCDLLNYPVIQGIEMTMGSNLEYEKLMNWINGYHYAKEIVPKIERHRIIIEFDDYLIILCKPFAV